MDGGRQGEGMTLTTRVSSRGRDNVLDLDRAVAAQPWKRTDSCRAVHFKMANFMWISPQ